MFYGHWNTNSCTHLFGVVIILDFLFLFLFLLCNRWIEELKGKNILIIKRAE